MIRAERGEGTTRVELTIDGAQAVSGLEVLDLWMWFSGAKISTGGISAVFCKEEYRNCGYAKQCMEYAMGLQQRDGKLVSFLFGIPNFYERFGYTVVMPWYGIYVPLEAWKDLPREPVMHEPNEDHRRAALKLYQGVVGLRIGPVARDPDSRIKPHKTVRWWTHGLMRALLDGSGEVAGYVWHSEIGDPEFEVVEVGAADDAAREQILAYLLHETKRRGKPEFITALPPDDPFSLFLRSYNARFIVATRTSGGGMARIIDFKGLCNALTPVFQRRLRAVWPELIPRHLALSMEGEEAIVELGGSGPPAKIAASRNVMTKLFFGYITPAEALASHEMNSPASEIGELLFPRNNAFMYLRDRF